MKTAPATGDCGFCEWGPDKAHPHVNDADWKFAEWVDDTTWLCPACGMPNTSTNDVGETSPDAQPVVEVPTLAPPPVGDTAEHGGEDDGEGVGDSVPPSREAPPDPPSSPEPIDAVARSIELLTDVGTVLDALKLNVSVELPMAGPDPFTIADLLAGVHAATTELLGVELTLAVSVASALAEAGSPDPATLEGGSSNGEE